MAQTTETRKHIRWKGKVGIIIKITVNICKKESHRICTKSHKMAMRIERLLRSENTLDGRDVIELECRAISKKKLEKQ